MFLAIGGIVSCSILSLFYILSRYKISNFWSTVTRTFTTLSFVVFALMIFFINHGPYNPAYGFIVLSLVFATIGDYVSERKDVADEKEKYLIGSVVMFAAHIISAFIALIILIWEFANITSMLVAGLIAFAGAAIIIFVAKSFKVDFQKMAIHTYCYFFTNIFLLTLSIWYYFTIKNLLFFTLYSILLFINNIFLLKLNFGKQTGKSITFFVHRVIYYAALVCLLTFIYFELITLMA